jgi:hypothetical protein
MSMASKRQKQKETGKSRFSICFSLFVKSSGFKERESQNDILPQLLFLFPLKPGQRLACDMNRILANRWNSLPPGGSLPMGWEKIPWEGEFVSHHRLEGALNFFRN